MSTGGRIVIPAELRRADHIKPGQQFSVERQSAGVYLLRRISGAGKRKRPNLVDWLLACPGEGWFREMPSESTDTLGKDLFS